MESKLTLFLLFSLITIQLTYAQIPDTIEQRWKGIIDLSTYESPFWQADTITDGKLSMQGDSTLPYIRQDDLLFTTNRPGWSMRGGEPR